ncbi:MAG: hydroxymyristoyl-ACP dehydratase [Pseudomonadota bacterium]
MQRIPHQGAMCLLDCVRQWDEQAILCEATSHRDTGNPLRAYGRLGSACGIEYAAQAMAMHGALMAESAAARGHTPQRPGAGYLVSVRGVILHVDRLDDRPENLVVEARRLSGDSGTVLYAFTIRAAAVVLLEGRAAVVLDAASHMSK